MMNKLVVFSIVATHVLLSFMHLGSFMLYNCGNSVLSRVACTSVKTPETLRKGISYLEFVANFEFESEFKPTLC
jgi:hypothetical protein